MSYHTFRASVDPSRCLFCNLSQDDHVCAICDAIDKPMQKMAGMLYCEECMVKEEQAQIENAKLSEDRIKALQARIPEPDTSIEIVTDVFNANIAAIEDIRKEIEADTSIENKHFELAQRIEARFDHFKQVVADAQKTVKDGQQQIRTIQTYYNELAKKLKAEERERIKIQDVKYAPPEKPIKPPKAPKISTQKFSMKELKEAAGISGFSEQSLRIICIDRNCTVREAVQIYAEIKNARK